MELTTLYILNIFIITLFNRETIVIGYTDFTDDEIRDLVKELGTQFRGDCYHVLHNNCNHFSDTLCKVYIT